MNGLDFDPSASRQQFIDLMVRQIQYQDPLDPVSQQDITGQLAQFSTVEGVNELNLQFSEMLKTQTLFNGLQLVGSLVEYESPSGQGIVSGKITAARIENNSLSLTVGDEQISIDDVTSVISGDESV